MSTMPIDIIDMSSPQLDRLPEVTGALAANAERNDRTADFPAEGIRAVHAAGLLTATVARRYGGPGAGLADTARILNALGRGDPSVALITAMTLFTHAAQDASRPGRTTSTGRPWGVGHHARADQRAPGRARARHPGPRRPAQDRRPQDRGGWAVTGRKIFSTGAVGLRWMAVWARTDDESRRRAASWSGTTRPASPSSAPGTTSACARAAATT